MKSIFELDQDLLNPQKFIFGHLLIIYQCSSRLHLGIIVVGTAIENGIVNAMCMAAAWTSK